MVNILRKSSYENIDGIFKKTEKLYSLIVANKMIKYLDKYKNEKYSFTNTKK